MKNTWGGEIVENLNQEVRALRVEVDRLRKENAKLRAAHAADIAQIVYQRRQIDFLMEVKENED